jgi:cellulose synthase/poly-beta-1,6-N-acetylglucosamine synthase-like glycosyltransferase/spore germination protein YaaH/peptidoglycan/xylan/chitin deacetylase (PgdA/CDA1 family)/uncharacterized protein (DUF2062 family)
MTKKICKRIARRMLSTGSPWKLALATSIGIFFGMLPFFQIKLIVILVLSVAFSLNLVCLLSGIIIAILLPALHLFTNYLSLQLRVLHLPSYVMQNWNFPDIFRLHFIPKFNLLSTLISCIIISLISFVIFYLIYKYLILKSIKYVNQQIFSDIKGHRWPITKVILSISAGIVVIVVAMVLISVNTNPILPNLKYDYVNNITDISPFARGFNINTATARDQLKYPRKKPNKSNHSDGKNESKKVFAFYVNWDEDSLKSLKQNIQSIDYVIPNWYTLDKNAALVVQRQVNVDEFVKTSHKSEMPLVNNMVSGNWNSAVLHNLILNEKEADVFINAAISDIKSNHYSGINVDFENLSTTDKTKYNSFMKKFYLAFHKQGLEVSLDVPAADDAFDYSTLINDCDYMIIMAYDEHAQTDPPGSIASASWISKTLDDLDVDSKKVIVSLGSYGYDWVVGSDSPADVLTFADVMNICSGSALNVHWDQATQNPYITYKEGEDDHIVWFLDAATFYNQVKQSMSYGAGGVALWRLGSEDFSIWNTLGHLNDNLASVNFMNEITTDLSVDYTGSGELLYISTIGKKGKRSFTLDKTGNITTEIYNQYPSSYLVKRFGKPKDKEIALTFDDGPDSFYTPKILDILEKNKVKASFFIIGENAQINPDLVQRIYNDGDDIGNHTFTHPNIARISQDSAKFELNSTQRLIEAITGHSTILFRAPYNADAEPSTLDELIPIVRAQQLGYIMVGESIDPLDWQSPNKNLLFSRIMNQVSNGNIILLHDGGGNRDSTVSVLQELITALKGKGYTFVTVNQLMNKSRDDIMPAVKETDSPYLTYDHTFFDFTYIWHYAVTVIFYVTIILGIFKLLFLGFLSTKQRFKKKKRLSNSDYTPFVSVIIPAFNEEKVICRTIESVLESNYKEFEVVFIDDGSSDNTYATVCQKFADDSRVVCIRKENGGKSSALNRGLMEAKGEIFIAVDADTVFDKEAIRLMSSYFSDPAIAAVSGNVKVGNKHGLLTIWQHCEYVTGFNLERRAYSELNCITVVPGAIGAWKKSYVLDEGGFKDDTLAEDTDMTLALLRKGYRIDFEENARAYTESPEDMRSLLKQRFRWTYGTLQCLWKHKNALFNKSQKTLGFIAMPFMWIFQYIFQTLSPIVDIYMFFSLFTGLSLKIVFWYVMFLLIDLLISCLAFRLENESIAPLIWLPLQRLVYRFLMTYVVIKSIIVAIKGKAVGWNKLKRTGNLTKS